MITPLSLETLLTRIRSKEPFTFTRWGDGEWRAVLGRTEGMNCDSHPFYPQMGRDLADVLKRRPEYLLGMQNLAMKLYGNSITGFLRAHGLSDLVWHDADVLHHGAMHGRLPEILDAVRTNDVLLIGPAHLHVLESKHLNVVHRIEVPSRTAYKALGKMVQAALAFLALRKSHTLVAVSASMPAEILIDRLYRQFGQDHTFIDFGSLWDPLAGIYSRRYMRKIT